MGDDDDDDDCIVSILFSEWKWVKWLVFIMFLFVFSDLVAELPFILMHPKPEEEPALPSTAKPSPSHGVKNDTTNNVPVDTNLIQLDT